MSNLQIFNNEQFGQVRVKEKNNEFWFVAKDVCDILEYSNHNQTLKRLDLDEKGVISIDTPGGKQEVTFVNEPGLYHLVLGSKKKKAKDFKRWITHDVLPEIRKTGSYSVEPKNKLDILRAAIDQIEVAQKQANEAKKIATETKKETEKIKDSFAKIENNWRHYVNKVFKSIGNQTGDFQSYRKESYAILNRRARCDLDRRLENKIERMKQNGATKTQINKANKLDVIEDDTRLTEIYISIVKEFEAKYLSQKAVSI